MIRAAADLQADIARVTGRTPEIRHNANSLGRNATLIGTLGRSRTIDTLARGGKIDPGQIAGKKGRLWPAPQQVWFWSDPNMVLS